jgi:hypothetical protein
VSLHSRYDGDVPNINPKSLVMVEQGNLRWAQKSPKLYVKESNTIFTHASRSS